MVLRKANFPLRSMVGSVALIERTEPSDFFENTGQ